jgi:hypothetical protein
MRRVDSERRRERNALAAERGVLGLHERALDPDIPHTPGFGQEGRTWNNLRPESSRFRVQASCLRLRGRPASLRLRANAEGPRA